MRNGEQELRSGETSPQNEPPISLDAMVREMILQQRNVLDLAHRMVDLCGQMLETLTESIHATHDDEDEDTGTFLSGERRPR